MKSAYVCVCLCLWLLAAVVLSLYIAWQRSSSSVTSEIFHFFIGRLLWMLFLLDQMVFSLLIEMLWCLCLWGSLYSIPPKTWSDHVAMAVGAPQNQIIILIYKYWYNIIKCIIYKYILLQWRWVLRRTGLLQRTRRQMFLQAYRDLQQGGLRPHNCIVYGRNCFVLFEWMWLINITTAECDI